MTTNPTKNLSDGKHIQYIVEDDIDFFNELRLIQQTITHKNNPTVDNVLPKPTTESVTDKDKTCLITNEPLSQFYVTLGCNHSFNYVPLYNEVKMQKCAKNVMDMIKCRPNEFRCPFCRKLTQTILTYYPELEETCPILYGVNTIDTQYKIIKTCQYIKYVYTDRTKMYCNFEGDSLMVSQVDNQYYCYTHKHIIEQQHNAVLKHKLRLEKNKKAKEEKAQQQLALKEKLKAEKLAKQQTPNTNVAQNLLESISGVNEVVLSNTTIEDNEPKCTQILKTGLFKGDPCNRVIFKYNMCKRHYNLSNAKLLPVTEVVILTDAPTSAGLSAL